MRKINIFRRKFEELEKSASPLNIVTYRKLVLMKFRRHRLAMFGMVTLLIVVIFSFFGPFFIRTKYDEMDFSAIFAPPLSRGHFLGTDELGHDIFVRLMYGGRISLIVGFASAAMTTFIGTVVGLLSGFYGGTVDKLLMRFVDIMLSIPMFPILLILTLVFHFLCL